jgi:hypothetical protein
MIKKPNEAQRWLFDHPNDPCPSDPRLARAWRRARHIGPDEWVNHTIRERYEAAMAEKRARERVHGPIRPNLDADQNETGSGSDPLPANSVTHCL